MPFWSAFSYYQSQGEAKADVQGVNAGVAAGMKGK
jgi:hypothetical protein